MIRVAQIATTAISVRFLLLDHIERLRREGYEVEAVCAADDTLPEIQGRGFAVQVLPLARELSPAGDLRGLLALRELFARRRYDVVHSHTPKAGLLAPAAGRLAGTPLIIHTIHGLLFHDRSPLPNKVLGAACELWSARAAHRLLSQSREDMEVARRVRLCPPDKIDYIGNGIDVRRFSRAAVPDARAALREELGFPGGAVVVGTAGRLVAEKGFRELSRALGRVMARRPEVGALVIGPADPGQSDGLDAGELLRGLDRSRVVHLGFRRDMPELYSAMDLFVLPSYREGIPRTLMEASAMELPVIGSNIRGCREVVRAGETGLLVEPRDAAGLAAAIESLAGDPARRAEMGRAGRRHIEAEFDAERVLDRLAAYYRRVAGAP